MVWSDGSKYAGQFVNGKMEGKGLKTWPNGNTYQGMFKNNQQHGDGEHFNIATNESKK